jgi:hypothetical protein
VVVIAHVSAKARLEAFVGHECDTVHHVRFEGMEERLGVSIVRRAATPRHALTYAQSLEPIAEGRGCVLDSAARVEDQPTCQRLYAWSKAARVRIVPRVLRTLHPTTRREN